MDVRRYAGSESQTCDTRVPLQCLCGACCRSLTGVPLYAALDRGDGVCRHLDEGSILCRIYADRPSICRVTEMYERYSDLLSWTEFVTLNLKSCDTLRTQLHSKCA